MAVTVMDPLSVAAQHCFWLCECALWVAVCQVLSDSHACRREAGIIGPYARPHCQYTAGGKQAYN